MNGQDLALTKKLIDKYGGGTVSDSQLNSAIDKKIADGTIASGEQLETIEQDVTLIKSKPISNSLNTNPIILDMHYGALKGQGFVGQVGQFKWAYPTNNANKGDKVLFLQSDATTLFVVGQLVAIRYSNGEYENNIIASIDSTNKKVITLKYPLKYDMVADWSSSAIYDAYENFAHPWTYGYYSIADFALEELVKQEGTHIKRIYAKDFAITGTATSFLTGYEGYHKLGGKIQSSYITSKAQNDGIQYEVKISESSTYRIEYLLNTNSANVSFQILNSSGVLVYENINNEPTVFKNCVNVNLENDIYTIKFICKDTFEIGFNIYIVDIIKANVENDLSYYNRGNHVFLGDSWFENGKIMDRIKTKLPNATFFNYGVGGNNINSILRRLRGTATIADKTNPSMTDDVFWSRSNVKKVSNPTFIWVMNGTNDYLVNRDVVTYHKGMKEISNEIVKLGAKPIFFNCSVGDINKNGGAITQDIFKLSRQYSDFTFLSNDLGSVENDILKTTKTTKVIIPFTNISVNANSKALLASIHVKDSQFVVIERIDFVSETNKIIECGYSSVLGYLDHPTPTEISASPTLDLSIGKPATGGRYLNLVANNKTAGVKLYSGVLTIKIISD